ncbi:hypothetical protein [Sphingomonas lenta]|uniref:Uncharacterized protein n=1 Tax=Sphingomonas lenta TaxID=1141887 RepID=A0A2A2SER0_9SPHN|nr:hypothetical protein [Sphingomonas lenta]PAX07690.1 hypothetical protein CKY28_08590 [Sphingomonas lenta]
MPPPAPRRPVERWRAAWVERLRRSGGRRAAGAALALLTEAALVLLLLTIAPRLSGDEKEERTTVFAFSRDREEAVPAEAPTPPDEARPADERAALEPVSEPADAPANTPAVSVPEPAPPPPVPTPAPPTSLPAPVILLTREQMAAADIARGAARPSAIAPPRRAVAGPPNVGGAMGADTPRVDGTGPNGEPLYAASWYREPYPEELRGYLSTSRGPGWGLIACRTVADYRVEDCVAVGEYPQGSNIARAVLAAAWQFRVRPPRLGGMPKVGEWVRIRIDYELRGR